MRLRAALLIAAAALAACGRSGSDFRLSGSITVAPQMRKTVHRPNTLLLIVATNEAGIPVAVKRIINPKLPIRYSMRDDDLVLPGPAWKGPLRVIVYVNRHGKVGVSVRGDLRGSHRGPAFSGEKNVNIVIDEAL